MWLLDALDARKNSNEIAVIYREERVTFSELWKRSEALAVYLEENFSLKEDHMPVVIYGNKETDILVAMHAALKIGIPYVPVDTSYPIERLVKIMGQVQAKILINFSDVDIDYNVTVLRGGCLPQIYQECTGCTTDKSHWVNMDDDCYILFTSGSTGEPKGVPIKRRNLENFINWFSKYCGNNGIVLNQPPYSFDLSVIAIYVNLSAGCTLFSVDKEMIANFNTLFCYLSTSNINIWISTPSFLNMLFFDTRMSEDVLPSLKRFVFDGEILTKGTVNAIYERFPQAVVVNAYGPTECTVAISACEIEPWMMRDSQSLPVGHILPDAHYYIDEAFEDCGKHIGELKIVSKNTGCGYYKNPIKTAESFWFDDKLGLYGYKTGDLVYEDNGFIYYVGRIDSQIKLNGYRIELDDISENINKLDFINNSVVLPIKDDSGKIDYLTAIVVLKDGVKLSGLKLTVMLKKELSKLIPLYMVPKKVVAIEKFPLNVNGKIDRKRILEDIRNDNR